MPRKIASTSRNLFRDNAGFTLIELMMVVLIIGILSAAALPNFFSSARRGNFQSMVSSVSTMFEKARTQALASELDADWKTPPGGYGLFIDLANQQVLLFIDDFHAGCTLASCKVNMNYANEDIAKRITPDGIYTAGGDTVVETVQINKSTYMKLSAVIGKKMDDSIWNATPASSLTVIFTPPYADASIVADDAGSKTSLKEFEAKFESVTENIFRKIKFNRITTTPQITQGKNAAV